jgi:hypothetical protein
MQKLGTIILNLDRRVIYTIVFLCVLLPLLHPLELPFEPTQEVRDAYNDIENLEPGSTVLISCDFGPSTIPENYTMLEALLHQCFRRHLRVIALTLVPAGASLGSRGLREAAEFKDASGKLLYPYLEYGRDYVYLGYKPGGTAVMLSIGQSFTDAFPRDHENRSTRDMPIFREISSLGDCKYIFDIASVGYPEYWVSYASERENVPLSVNCTAVSAAQYYPYYASRQFRGLVGGMKGAAEYEKLVNMEAIIGRIPDATKGMDAQSAVHLFIVLAIIIANVFYFLQGRQDRREGEIS